ncbi:hypothetical protein ISG41_04315 [Mammaliicoccus fleurettii]|nr:hypothetical protein ISG40_04315 [Mammaliicoccus fleurettii]QPA35294.1 hypothetical protein ISG41_04315 [Mammaliicoccus fleurettii]
MVQLLRAYFERFFYELYHQVFSQYLNHLDLKIHDIDQALYYMQYKKVQLQLMIDRRTIELENKYIDLMDQHHIQCAKNIYGVDINTIKDDLNEIEKEYAQLESFYQQLNEDKNYVKRECDLLQLLLRAY